MKRLAAIAIATIATTASAAPLVVTKSSVIVTDQVNVLNPKALPNATIDYAIRVENPNGLLSGQAIAAVVIEDAIPASVVLRVADYAGAGSGPVEFADGGLLGLGLLDSGLDYRFAGLGSGSDGIEFYDGTSWAYTPVPDTQGYDARVRAVRVRLSGVQAASTAFRLRFRVKLN